jgi:hypothetical protein
MDFERYYIDLLEMLNAACKKIASGTYDKRDTEMLFGISQTGRYPSLFSDLADPLA